MTFSAAGTFEYFCEVHSAANLNTMNGTVIVTGGGGGTPGVLQFSTGNTSAAENGGNKTITVTRTGGDDGPVSVSYETVDGSATFPTDYIQTNNLLNWADNDDNNKTFQVPIVNDSIEEPSQSFTIRLSNPGGGATLGTNQVIVVTINDDDAPSGSPGTIRFTSASAGHGQRERGERHPDRRARQRLDRRRSRSCLSTANGTAIAGSDYQAVPTTSSPGATATAPTRRSGADRRRLGGGVERDLHRDPLGAHRRRDDREPGDRDGDDHRRRRHL